MIRHNYEPKFTKEELNRYLASLDADGLSERSKEIHRIVLKCWWEALGLSWPLSNRRVHKKSTGKKTVSTFTVREIHHLISLVKQHGTAEDKFYICLATIFAPRRGEIGQINQKNFNWQGDSGTLFFQTEKHGLFREHIIPAELVPYLRNYNPPQTHSVHKMSKKFIQICKSVGFEIPQEKPCKKKGLDGRKVPTKAIREELCPNCEWFKRGKCRYPHRLNCSWHAFRHALDSALLEAGIDHLLVRRWMGWKSYQGMEALYYIPNNLQAKVMAKHPFLKYWK